MLEALVAQSSSQTPTWLTAAIGVGGLVLGIVAAVIGNYFVARAKVREAEMLYRQKLADSYLATAREYTHEIYVPLSVMLSALADACLALREHIDFETATAPEGERASFRESSEQFIADTAALTARGADAFMTTDLEARLRDFTHFLRSSQEAKDTVTKVVIQSFLLGSNSTSATTTSTFLPTVVVAAGRVASSMSIALGSLKFDAHTETLAAPITSRAFEERFNRDILVLKASIKLVTLGAKEPA